MNDVIEIPVLSGTITHIPSDVRALHDMRTVYHAILLIKSVLENKILDTDTCGDCLNCEYHCRVEGVGFCLYKICQVNSRIEENPKWRELFPWEVEHD